MAKRKKNKPPFNARAVQAMDLTREAAPSISTPSSKADATPSKYIPPIFMPPTSLNGVAWEKL